MDKKLPVKTIIMMDSYTFDKIVTEEFGKPYSSQRALGYAGQNTLHYINIEQDVMDEEYLREEGFDYRNESEAFIWEDWFDAKESDFKYSWQWSDRSPSVGVVCAKLRERGWEIPDEFQMEVSW